MSVGQAQDEIDAREFAEWEAYYTIEPFGEERADYRNAILCALIANALGKKRQPKHFMPDFTIETKPQTPADMRALMNLYAALHNRKHG